MAWARFAVVLLMTFLVAEASLQQPPGDNRGIRESSGQLATEAHEAYRVGHWATAAEKYEAALAAQPDLVGLFFYLGNCYDNLSTNAEREQRQGLLEKAVLNYHHAAERDPAPKMRRLATDYLVAAYGPEKLNQPQAAIEVLEHEIAGDSPDASALSALANLFERVGRFADAERTLRECDATSPDGPCRTQLTAFSQRRARRKEAARLGLAGEGVPSHSAAPASPPDERARAYRGGFAPPVKLKHVDPVVPDAVLLANTDGIVIVEVVIDTRGRVSDARVLRSVAGLDDAALAAVRQWEFSPTTIDGKRVPVILTVTVPFKR